MTRALGYLRVSTDDQATNGHGLSAQRATIRAEAKRRGWTVKFIEDAASGKRINPKLRTVLNQLQQGRADALIVAKLDRLARSVGNAVDIMDAARNQGWDLVICDLGVDLSTPSGEAMANMLATFAQYERRIISQRTKEGLAVARAKGKPIGRPRLASAHVVDLIVTRREAGHSFGAIARDLTAQGELSPQGKATWQPSTVRRIYNAATRTTNGDAA